MNMKSRDNIMIALASGDQKSKAIAATALTLGMASKPNGPPANNFKTRASNCILVTIVIICVCVLVACGVMIVREYALAKGYHATRCRVKDLFYVNDISCTFCGSGTKNKKTEKKSGACVASKFPCLKVNVEFHAKGERHDGLIHPDSLQAAGEYGKSCSFAVCRKSEAENRKAVKEYENTWRSRGEEQFDCYYSTDNLKHVILEKMHTKEDVLHSMLWPSVIIVICGVIFLRLEMKRRDIKCCPQSTLDNEPVKDPQHPHPPQPQGNRATGSHDHSTDHLLDSRNCGGGSGACSTTSRHPSDKNTLLKYKPDIKAPPHVECALSPFSADNLNSQYISSSLSSLDRLAKTVDKSRLCTTNGRVMSCVSDNGGLRPGVREPPDGGSSSASCSPSHRQKSALAGSTYSPYSTSPVSGDAPSHHGSKIKGLETPV